AGSAPSEPIRSDCRDADRLSNPSLIDTDAEPLVELRPASPARNIANGDRNGLLLADENHEPLAAGEAGVEQISLQHWVVLGHDRDDHGGILRALALVDGGGV